MAGARAEIVVVEDSARAAEVTAERVVAAAASAVERSGRFLLALSGGDAPRPLYALLASEPWRARVDWPRVHVFLIDERFVPVSSPESNAGMVESLLVRHVPLPPEQFHPFNVGSFDVEGIALQYERLLVGIAGDPPRLDFLLMGLGEDAHTASLFPQSPVLSGTSRLVVPTVNMKLATRQRLTMTPRAINAGRAILFLVTGPAKAKAVRDVLDGPREPFLYPGQVVEPVDGTLTWVLDRSAAAQLESASRPS